MKLRNAIIPLLLVPLISAAQKRPESRVEYKSPDGALVAVILSSQAPEGEPESRIEIRARGGKLLTKRSYTSGDGQHGYGVTKATWTPNSQFFVFSLENSGGHSPWHSPVQVFDRSSNVFVSVDDALDDAVMNPNFTVSAPDGITVELWFSGKTRTISLSMLNRQKKAKVK